MQTPSAPPLKGRYPFRLATTSFIYPAGWADNARRLAPLLDEIELLFFESGAPERLPDTAEMERLAAIAAQERLTYTIHLPVDVDLGAVDAKDRRRAAETLAGICSAAKRLPVTSHTLHLPYPRGVSRGADAVRRWQTRTRQGLERLLAAGVAPGDLSIETLDYPFEWAAPLVEALGLRVCLDIGHLILYGYDLPKALGRYLPRTEVIHLHGVSQGRDHRPLDELADARLHPLLEYLRNEDYTGSLSLEVFGLEALERSMACFSDAWEAIDTRRQ